MQDDVTLARRSPAARSWAGWRLLGMAVCFMPAPISAQITTPAQTSVPSPVADDKAGASPAEPDQGSSMTMEIFLDRLMRAESGGRLDARNPRSTAVGPFQFIESTFLAVARRYFASEVSSLSDQQILALRSNVVFSRKAAEAYTRENAAVLQGFEVKPTYPHLRLAYLLGPHGAARVLKAAPDAQLAALLPPAVLVANPFMAGMTALGLVHRAARDIAQPVAAPQGVEVVSGAVLPHRTPGIRIRCNLKLPSCKHWLALHTAGAGGENIASKKQRAAVAAPTAALSPPGNVRLAGKPSPTMEAAARGIPLSMSRSSLGGPPISRKHRVTSRDR